MIPVILSGGSGTRLWPLSREAYPKQFLSLCDADSMLQATWRRAAPLASGAPLVVASEAHRFMVAEQLRLADCAPSAILLEPVGRNTAPAIAVAALQAIQDHADPVLLVLPSDHMIGNVEAFHVAVRAAEPAAAAGKLVMFGIVPTSAETGYGYIRAEGGRMSGCNLKILNVAQFVEKPDAQTAEHYVASGEYVWNSGIFLFRASVFLAELKRQRPDILTACEAALANCRRDVDFVRLDKAAFIACPADSIDYAVMQGTDNAVVLPVNLGWSDVGCWSALWALVERDGDGNARHGDVIASDCRNTMAWGDGRLVALLGLDDIVVVDTADVVLVAHRDQAQHVKRLVSELKAAGRPEPIWHRKVYRPWGSYDAIDMGDRFQVKRISVKPGGSLSLQMHHHRAEHWIVVRGTGRITRGDEVLLLTENQSTYIPLGVRHRLENPGKLPLEMIEVQSGSYLGEDDIVRFDDAYGRS